MTHPATTASGPSTGPKHRPLNEPVLMSIESEIGAQSAQSAESDPRRAAADPRFLAGNGSDSASSFWWLSMREQLSAQVRQRPGRSALLALAAGTVAAWLLTRSRRRERGAA